MSSLRRYQGFMCDSARWERLRFRPDDIVISTPAKSGTTWMQTIVGMLLLDRPDLGAPLSTLSPWLDMQIYSDDQILGLLDSQSHRRFIKTHTPLDGIPTLDSVTYIALVRHPLDIALSDRDHMRNMRSERAVELRTAAVGEFERDPGASAKTPDDPREYLRWFIDNDEEPTGSGPYGLADYANQVRTYWEARGRANVHLFHYADMWSDLDDEMRRVAAALSVPIDEKRWPGLVAAAGFDSMKSRASVTVPEAHLDLWDSPEAFFRSGGTRDWEAILGGPGSRDIAHFEKRLDDLAGDAADWCLRGRGALGS